MPSEESLMLPNAENTLRINKDLHKPYYFVFQDEVKDNKFLTREIRSRIINRWLNLTPKIPKINLQNYLSNMERHFWSSIPVWEQRSLTSKITYQTMDLQEQVLDAKPSDTSIIVKKARVIDQLNQTISKVNKLIDQTPAATFSINIGNLNEDSMTAEMNGSITAEISEDNEE